MGVELCSSSYTHSHTHAISLFSPNISLTQTHTDTSLSLSFTLLHTHKTKLQKKLSHTLHLPKLCVQLLPRRAATTNQPSNRLRSALPPSPVRASTNRQLT